MPSFAKFLPLAAAAASLATGFKIPENQADGLYSVNLDTGDVELLESINSSEVNSARARRAAAGPVLQARAIPLPVSDSGCPNVGLNPGDYLASYATFSDYCDRGGKIPRKGITYGIVGSSVWYACSYGGEQPCDSPELSDAERRFNDKCGVAKAGWIHMKDWAKTYGRDIITGNICTNI